MQTIETVSAFRTARVALKGRVGAVFTMGALHEGHLSLIQLAKASCDHVVGSVFVNPTQFGPREDFTGYPRDLDGDLRAFETAGVDLVFAPHPEIMYPPHFQTYIEVGEVSHALEGSRRRGFFRGVATVVLKLLNITQPDLAYFGQKDAQQVAVVKAMVRDFNLEVDIKVAPIVREEGGIALSSRNRYLSASERKGALVLYQGLQAASDAYEQGERSPKVLRRTVLKALIQDPYIDVDYVSAADVATMDELHEVTDQPMLLSLAARVGKTRLIDNVILPRSLENIDDLSKILGGE
jgi:pantoate--beta-alanine ligase